MIICAFRCFAASASFLPAVFPEKKKNTGEHKPQGKIVYGQTKEEQKGWKIKGLKGLQNNAGDL